MNIYKYIYIYIYINNIYNIQKTYIQKIYIFKKYTVNTFKHQSACIYLLFRLNNMDLEEGNLEK